MTKEEFKQRWETDWWITWDDIAKCAVDWGLMADTKGRMMKRVRYAVLKAAGTIDAEEFAPDNYEDEEEPWRETDARDQV